MSKSISNHHSQRYLNPDIIAHLASQYVLGTLTARVHNRVAVLAVENESLDQLIQYWQDRLVILDHQTPEVPVDDVNWQMIADKLDIPQSLQQKRQQTDKQTDNSEINTANNKTSWFSYYRNKFNRWLSTPTYQYASAFSILVFGLIIGFMDPLSQQFDNNDPLSYVAVLTQEQGQAHLVASSYGESQKLVVNIVNVPTTSKDEALELWVVSKTDQQARSLGVLPNNTSLFEQKLTDAQWRLIKDSESLIVTIEENGGSPIGEPSDVVVSRGLCVRLQDWSNNA
jgi:anti-sigma-K factor RskA